MAFSTILNIAAYKASPDRLVLHKKGITFDSASKWIKSGKENISDALHVCFSAVWLSWGL